MEKTAVFLDLDGTLLNSQKVMTASTLQTLECAAERGALIIPATGRFYMGIPEEIRRLPFVRYCVNINGAEVYDAWEDRVLHREEIPIRRAMEIFTLMEHFSGIYDCYAGGQGYMDSDFYARIPEFIPDESRRRIILSMREPVERFRETVEKRFPSIQKTQQFFVDMEERNRCIAYLTEALPDCSVTTSLEMNVEVNSKNANKGQGLLFLRDYLGLPGERIIAFGDNSNDVSMLRSAGIGVAMGNGTPEALAAADMVTASNDEDGVAQALSRLLHL